MHKINVTVTYVGHDDFKDAFPPGAVLQAIKAHALRYFNIEEAAIEKYVLQSNGVDLDDKAHLSELESDPVTLTLALKEEVQKGSK